MTQHAANASPAPATLSPQQVAEAVRDGMLPRDNATLGLGMEIEAVGPGYARIAMTVRDDMLNGFAICHGGFITALADSTFAFACNSYNEVTVASGIAVDFVAPAKPGDRLTAEAREVSQAGRTGVYDVRVTRPGGELVAVMRGRSYRMRGKPVVTL